jgi:23S rRNA pseudouridine2604 synthase
MDTFNCVFQDNPGKRRESAPSTTWKPIFRYIPMTDSRRKILGLPVRAKEERVSPDPRRKPVRGMARGERRLPAGLVAEQPAGAEKTGGSDWRKKPRPPKPQTRQSETQGGRPPARGAGAGAVDPRGGRSPTRGAKTGVVDSRSGRPPARGAGAGVVDPRGGRGESAPVEARTERTSAGVRVSKLLAERGLCSRREADEFIVRGWVYVDGERVAELGTRADPAARITLDAQARDAQRRQMTILLHKPAGYVSGQPETGCQPAVVLIRPESQRTSPDTPLFHASHLKGLAPAGRLDADSTGLLVLTQNGRVARQLIGENSKVDKEYLVRVAGQLVDGGLALLNHGLSLDDKPLKPARVEWLNEDQLRFVLNEGRKRQIRRMCELVGLRVTGLKRVRIGNVRLGDLPLGQWRYLKENESF